MSEKILSGTHHNQNNQLDAEHTVIDKLLTHHSSKYISTNMKENIFSTTTRVLYGDTDAGGVVYNANYLRYFEIGRTELMREWVCSYRHIETLGLVLPVTECWSRYKAPAFYDDLLTIETTVAEVNSIKCKFNYRILRPEEHLNRPKLLVKGYTIHAAVTRNGKLARLPEEIITKLADLSKERK